MSATAQTPVAGTPGGTIDISGTAPVSFGRLVGVEWRKMFDTRSGRWLFAITVALLVVVVAIVLIVIAADDSTMSYSDWLFQALLIPISILLPVFPILCITSEWSQRTGLTTFVLESHRIRLVLAKLVAVTMLALATLVIAAVLGAIANVLGASIGGYDAVWTVDGRDIFWNVLTQILFFLMAFGFGAMLLNSSAAVAVFYVFAIMLPFMVFFGLVASFGWASDIIPFFDLQTSSAQVSSGEMLYSEGFLSGPQEIGSQQYLQFASALVLWVVLPLTVGMRRILRTEIK